MKHSNHSMKWIITERNTIHNFIYESLKNWCIVGPNKHAGALFDGYPVRWSVCPSLWYLHIAVSLRGFPRFSPGAECGLWLDEGGCGCHSLPVFKIQRCSRRCTPRIKSRPRPSLSRTAAPSWCWNRVNQLISPLKLLRLTDIWQEKDFRQVTCQRLLKGKKRHPWWSAKSDNMRAAVQRNTSGSPPGGHLHYTPQTSSVLADGPNKKLKVLLKLIFSKCGFCHFSCFRHHWLCSGVHSNHENSWLLIYSFWQLDERIQ